MKPTPKRRRLIVDRQLQGSMIRHGLVHSSIVMAVLCGGIFLPLVWGLDDGVLSGAGIDEASIVMVYLHERLWLIAVLCGLLVVVGSMLFSHRIAGPMVRVRRNLGLLEKGELPEPLRTRPRDYLKAEVDCLNDAVAGIRQRVVAIRAAQSELERQVQELAEHGAVPADDFAGVRTAIAGVTEAIEGFRDSPVSDDVGAAAARSKPTPATAPILAGRFD